jgi:anti-anti-sigma factor
MHAGRPRRARCQRGCPGDPGRRRVGVTITLGGELDSLAVTPLRDWLRGLRVAGVSDIELDFAEVTFMDSAGLHMALEWAADSDARGGSFSITRCPTCVRRLFELTGTTHLLRRSCSSQGRRH